MLEAEGEAGVKQGMDTEGHTEEQENSAGRWGQGGDTPGACTPNPPGIQGARGGFPMEQELCCVPGVAREEGWELHGHGIWVSHQPKAPACCPAGQGLAAAIKTPWEGRGGWAGSQMMLVLQGTASARGAALALAPGDVPAPTQNQD